MSDVFGSLVKQMAAGQTADKADWLIGAGLLMPSVSGVALRSMKDPGTAYNDPQPGRILNRPTWRIIWTRLTTTAVSTSILAFQIMRSFSLLRRLAGLPGKRQAAFGM